MLETKFSGHNKIWGTAPVAAGLPHTISAHRHWRQATVSYKHPSPDADGTQDRRQKKKL